MDARGVGELQRLEGQFGAGFSGLMHSRDTRWHSGGETFCGMAIRKLKAEEERP